MTTKTNDSKAIFISLNIKARVGLKLSDAKASKSGVTLLSYVG